MADHSLLRRSDGEGEPRFTILEMVRESAREQLTASSEKRAIWERRAARCMAPATDGRPDTGAIPPLGG